MIGKVIGGNQRLGLLLKKDLTKTVLLNKILHTVYVSQQKYMRMTLF